MRYVLWGIIICCFLGQACGPVLSYVPDVPIELIQKPHKKHKKKKSWRKRHKIKKHKTRHRHHKKKGKSRKRKIYSEKKIEELLENDDEDETCNRLNCASKLSVAKECLKTRASHRRKTKCFRAFCAYGCNEEDYTTKADVYDFCNKTCSSKKYLKNKIRPE